MAKYEERGAPKNYLYDLRGKEVQRQELPNALSTENLESLADFLIKEREENRNISSETLLSVCSALGVSLNQGSSAGEYSCLPKTELRGGHLSFEVLKISDETEGKPHSHKEEELLFCLSGNMTVDLNGMEKILKERDSILFFGSEPHSFSGNAMVLRILVKPEQRGRRKKED